jgi:hypothetical protein
LVTDLNQRELQLFLSLWKSCSDNASERREEKDTEDWKEPEWKEPERKEPAMKEPERKGQRRRQEGSPLSGMLPS